MSAAMWFVIDFLLGMVVVAVSLMLVFIVWGVIGLAIEEDRERGKKEHEE